MAGNAMMGLLWSPVEEGAKGQIWAAVAPKSTNKQELGTVVSGEYYTPVGVPGNGSWHTRDEALARRLWDWTEKELEGYEL